MNLHALAGAALLAVLLPMSGVRADVLVDNLLEPQRDTTPVESGLWAAQSFITAGGPVTLQSIELWLGLRVADPALTVELRADSAGGPAAALAAFGLPSLSAGLTQIELLPSVPQINLAAGTKYWIVLGVSGPGSFGWTYAEGNNQAGPGTLGDYSYSSDGGAGWAAFGTDNPYLLRVNVAPAVPEPASVALLLAGIGLLAARRSKPRH